MRHKSTITKLLPLLVMLALGLLFTIPGPDANASSVESLAVEGVSYSPVLAPFSNCAAVSEIPTAECQDLVNLYDTTNGLSWDNNGGWKSTDTPCSWYGVTCDNSSPERHVTELALDRNNLNGTLPEFDALSYLEELDLYNNSLSGPIPNLSALTSLVRLDLFLNSFTGPIHSSISTLTNLDYLDLSWNQLDNSIPNLSALTSLRTLRLNDNNLTGTIPPLSSVTSLEHLYLHNNLLDGDIPALLSLASLRTLNLSDNQLDNAIPDLSANTSLRQVYLHKNTLTGGVPEVDSLPDLVQLYLSENQLSGAIPNLPTSLVALYLDNNRLSGEIPLTFTGLNDLSVLDLSYNMLMASDSSVNSFVDGLQSTWENTQTVPVSNFVVEPTSSTSVSLTWDPFLYTAHVGFFEISYSENPIGPFTTHGQTPDKSAVGYSIANLTPDTAYYFRVQTHTSAHGVQQNNLWSEHAMATYYGIPSDEYDALVALYNATSGSTWHNRTGWLATDTPCTWHGVTCTNSHVTEITLSSNNLDGSLPAWGALDYLEILNLSNNQLSGTIPNFPLPDPASPGLKEIALGYNQLTGNIPSLSALTYLTSVTLGDNQLDGVIPNLSGLTYLERLYLWDNQLSSNIPDLSSLSALRYFNVNNNQLTGPFPYVATLTNLEGVWLSGNQLSGTIPDLSANTALKSLTFDNNRLSGEIHPSLATLPDLGYVNPHYNQLTSSDATLIAFLNTMSASQGWTATQTLPVTDVALANAAPTSIDLTWQPIEYTADGGYYEVQVATNIAGPWTANGQTTDKSVDHYTVTGLVANTHYYFRVRTFTPAHGAQQSDLEGFYAEIMEYHVYWTLITERELYARMQAEMASNPAIQEITFALADFVPGAIHINVGTQNGDVGTVATSIGSDNGLTLVTIESITLDGAPAPDDYAAIIHRELMPLLVNTFNTLLDEKMGTGLDLDTMRVTDESIEAAFPPP